MSKENIQTTTCSNEYLDKVKKENKTKQFNLRLTPTEMDKLGRDAMKANLSIAEYIVTKLNLK